MEKKDLRVNMGKTKIMASGMNLDLLKKSGKDPCGVCQTGVGSSSIFCGGCLCWIHKNCSGIKGPLRSDPDFRCTRCLRTAWPIDGRTVKEVKVDDEKLEAVPEFCYLGDMLYNDRAMIRWICNVKAKDEVSSDSHLSKLGIQDLDVVLRTSRMRWFWTCRAQYRWEC